MGIINDRRPRDWAYLAAFNEKELPSLQQMIKQVNETHNTQIIEDFNSRCEQRIKEGDHTVTKSEDLVVNAGLQQSINLILGTSSTRWRYISFGAGTTAANVSNTSLGLDASGSLSPRVDTTVQGWNEAVGMKLFFGGVLGESIYQINSITELGIFTSLTIGTMLNRNVFANNSLTRATTTMGAFTFAKQVFIFSIVIEFCPVV
jgi:hypothetical protein